MKVFDIINLIEKMAPPEFAASWDNSGVQVAALREEIQSLAVLLDPTPEKLEQAVEAGADFILAHHPLLMQPRYPNRADSYLSTLSLLFTRNIWLYSAHTSLDANPEGPVRWLARDLGLQSLEVLESTVSLGSRLPLSPLSGFGFSGTLPEALSYDAFCRSLAAALGKDSWQACGPKPAQVFRVACCPGAGNSLLTDAAVSGADVYITGDVKYHTALEAVSLGLHVLDVGHFILEEEMMRRLAADLAVALPLPVRFIASRDPITVERCRAL
ncbi:MAG: Nif3-like dinuclear metal center hexameric protein [Desulfovibrionaceae bacterium]|nr:Nif3-like dinuclear metal center hexameric protein [Desulfovibrionaceae bacterium]